jgi:hypothetical protein
MGPGQILIRFKLNKLSCPEKVRYQYKKVREVTFLIRIVLFCISLTQYYFL